MSQLRERERLQGEASPIHDAAHIFNVVSHPSRLRILTALKDAPRTVPELVEDTGLTRKAVAQFIDLLARVGLAAPTRRDGVRAYEASGLGRSLVGVVGTLFAEVASPPVAVPPVSLPDLIACLKLFSDASRLRILNLLAARREVCVCHLQEALGLPQSTVSRHVTALKEAGMIVGRRHGGWVYYRLVRPEEDLRRVVSAQLDGPLDHDEVLRADIDRLDALNNCREPGTGDAKIPTKP